MMNESIALSEIIKTHKFQTILKRIMSSCKKSTVNNLVKFFVKIAISSSQGSNTHIERIVLLILKQNHSSFPKPFQTT